MCKTENEYRIIKKDEYGDQLKINLFVCCFIYIIKATINSVSGVSNIWLELMANCIPQCELEVKRNSGY